MTPGIAVASLLPDYDHMLELSFTHFGSKYFYVFKLYIVYICFILYVIYVGLLLYIYKKSLNCYFSL